MAAIHALRNWSNHGAGPNGRTVCGLPACGTRWQAGNTIVRVKQGGITCPACCARVQAYAATLRTRSPGPDGRRA